MKEKLKRLMIWGDVPAVFYFMAGALMIMGFTFCIIGKPLSAIGDFLFMATSLMTAWTHKRSQRLRQIIEEQRRLIDMQMGIIRSMVSPTEKENEPQPPMPKVLSPNGIPVGRADEKADGVASEVTNEKEN